MNTTYKNYIEKASDNRFDLYEKKQIVLEKDTTKGKVGDTVESEVLIGYGFSFDRMIYRIVTLELSKNKSTVDFKQYISEFKKLKNELTEIL